MKSVVSFLALLVAAILAGCSSYHAAVMPGRDLHACRVFFVQSNLNDDRGVASAIARSLRARGFEVTQGPLTMLPTNAEVIVMYDDRWTWDMKDHMTALRIGVWDADRRTQIGYANFEGAAALNATAADIVERLMVELLGPASPRPAPAE